MREKLAAAARWRTICNELIVLNFETGRYFSLNASAADIWGALVRDEDKDICVPMYAAKYHIGIEVAERDVAKILRVLINFGVVTCAGKSINCDTKYRDDGWVVDPKT